MLAVRFVVDERRYLYHFFGQLMDAAVWAAATIGPVRRALWTHSPYHGESTAKRPPSILGRLVADDLHGRQPRRLGRVPPTAKCPGHVGRDARRSTCPAPRRCPGDDSRLRDRARQVVRPLAAGDDVSPDLAPSISHTAPHRSVSTSRDCCPSQVAGETPDHATGPIGRRSACR